MAIDATTKSHQKKEAEKSFFDKTAHQFKDHSSISENDYELIFRKFKIGDDLKGLNILEAGCGLGDLGVSLSKKNAKVIGVDISEGMINLNQKLNSEATSYRCILGDLEDASIFSANSFDAVFCFSILHHFPKLDILVKNFSLWLKEGGVIFALEPNAENLINKTSKSIRKIVKSFCPRLLMGFSTVNEEIDHPLEDYIAIFKLNGFECEYATSLTTPNSLFRLCGFNLTTFISIIKSSFYCLATLFSFKKEKKGANIIFKMVLNATKKNDC